MTASGAAQVHLPATVAIPESSAQHTGAEQWLIALVIFAMLLLPLADRALVLLGSGLARANSLVTHLTLLVTLLGGLLAARSRRLIATPVLLDRLPDGARRWAGAFGQGIAAAITLRLAYAGWQFAVSERHASGELLPGIPLWSVEMLIPVAFVGIALRLVGHGNASRATRVLAAVIAGIALALWFAPLSGGTQRLGGIVLMSAAVLCGAPMFTIIGGMALLLMNAAGQPTAAIAVKYYSLATTPAVPTLPLFAFTGYLLAESGAAQRLVDLFRAMFGNIRGGMGIATVLSCAFFTTFTGASGVTILALGGLLMPVLRSAGYGERDSLGLVTGAGSLGLLFPPCLPVILYSIVAVQTLQGLDPDTLGSFDVSIEGMFRAALLPGVLLLVLVSAWGVWRQPRASAASTPWRWQPLWDALWAAKWELALPAVAVGALFGGWVSSPVQAAAVTAAYALLAEGLVHRDLRLMRNLPRIAAECGLLTGGILLILGSAMGLTNYLVTAEIPEQLTSWVAAHVHSPLLFLMALNVALLIVGCLMEIYSAIVVVVPLIVPLGLHYGVDPVHLGVIFLANLELGFLHPPVGINLFLSSYRFGKPIGEVVLATLPVMLILAAAVILITYWPGLTHWLPSLSAP
ncbi:MAG: TRAP transporter large permease subunit [Steroidobacterales bacterium]